ncbi:MAG: SUF system Fe-S cluster assembly protein, partial [Erythrobacter sp.]
MDSSAEKPPRARVSDAVDTEEAAPRTRDYLDGFLAAKPPEGPVGGEGSDLQADVIEALREIF